MSTHVRNKNGAQYTRLGLKFLGAGVTVSDNPAENETEVTILGGGGGDVGKYVNSFLSSVGINAGADVIITTIIMPVTGPYTIIGCGYLSVLFAVDRNNFQTQVYLKKQGGGIFIRQYVTIQLTAGSNILHYISAPYNMQRIQPFNANDVVELHCINYCAEAISALSNSLIGIALAAT